MIEKDGLTCRACLTLNPVGAPACVRCNTPLQPADTPSPPPPPVQPIMPAAGPSAPPVRTEPVQTAPVQTTPPPLTPARNRLRRRVLLVGNLVVLAVLVVGGLTLWLSRPHYLDTDQIATTLADRLSAKVTCPDRVRRHEGARFRCTATYPGGATAPVTVTVRNDHGDYTWAARRPR